MVHELSTYILIFLAIRITMPINRANLFARLREKLWVESIGKDASWCDKKDKCFFIIYYSSCYMQLHIGPKYSLRESNNSD